MRSARVSNVTRGVPLARNARVADTHWSRLRGLLGRPELAPGEGLLILPCRAVHTWGMRFSLDVALGDADGRIVATYPELRPWRTTSIHSGASWALELPRGTLEASGTTVGDDVRWEVVSDAGQSEPVHREATGGP